MPKRDYTLLRRCPHPGCGKHSVVAYSTRKAYHEAYKSAQGNPWRCLRHCKPEEVLNKSNTSSMARFTVRKNIRGEHYWHDTLTDKAILSNNIIGKGFRAFADDLPVGTKIEIITTLILPDGD